MRMPQHCIIIQLIASSACHFDESWPIANAARPIHLLLLLGQRREPCDQSPFHLFLLLLAQDHSHFRSPSPHPNSRTTLWHHCCQLCSMLTSVFQTECSECWKGNDWCIWSQCLDKCERHVFLKLDFVCYSDEFVLVLLEMGRLTVCGLHLSVDGPHS